MGERGEAPSGATGELEQRLAESEARKRAVGALKEAVEQLPETPAGDEEEREAQVPSREEIEAWRNKANEYDAMQARMLRAMADLENLQKRHRREVEEAVRRGKHALLKTLLPVFDNLELSLGAAHSTKDLDALVAGIRMILEQFRAALRERGIERVGEVGEAFDPALHEAIGIVETQEQEPNTVVNVVRPGYRDGDRVVRAAQVQVARRPESEA